MVQNEIQILPLSQSDKTNLIIKSVDSSDTKNGYFIVALFLAIFCYLTVKFNWFNEVEGQSETIAMTVGFFSFVFLLGFRTSWANSKKLNKFSKSAKKYCGNLKIIEKRNGDDDYEIYFEINPIVQLPVFLIQKWKHKSVFDEISVGDTVSFEYINELNLFLRLEWKNIDLRQFKP
jgi:hypothetical protein